MSEIWLTEAGVRLFALEQGQGPVLVFLHGGLASHEAVLPMVSPLAERCRVVTPDVRGSGRSWSSEPLTFDRLSEDLLRLLDHLGVEHALVGGVSSGSGPAVHFALHHPERTRGLLVVWPVYAGADAGYTPAQAEAFAGMDAVASRAVSEGIDVLRPMYFGRLPEAMAERAWALASGFDPGSVVATSRFVASGVQPFGSTEDLAGIPVPTLVVPGADPTHPPELAALYAESIARCTVVSAVGADMSRVLGEFCDSVTGAVA